MKKNNKGFTLIELLAVILILIVIGLIAIDKVKKSSDKAARNAASSNAITYIKAVDSFISLDNLSSSRLRYGSFTLADLDNFGIEVSGTKPNVAYIDIEDFKIKSACLEYDTYRVTYSNGTYREPARAKCKSSSTTPLEVVQEFAYTGEEKTFKATESSYYLLEAWGASGGNVDKYNGGYGGYASGKIHLEKDEILYVNVGGAGATNSTSSTYNGGGAGTTGNGASGGGATSIASSSGLIKDLPISELIMVAGGGGGASYYRDAYASGHGGSGGGFVGADAIAEGWAKEPSKGGTQTAGGRYGLTDGGNQYGNSGSYGEGAGNAGYGSNFGAGGGGLYGGGSGRHNGGGGGSGYIGNTRLTDKIMYSYFGTPSNETATKTKVTKQASSDATSNTAKIGDGFVRISKY